MPGIRLAHPTMRNCVVTVTHHRPYREPFLCPTCNVIHELKTYHLVLDHRGEVVVSKVVYERLRELKGLPFRTVETEPRPQPQTIVISAPMSRPKEA